MILAKTAAIAGRISVTDPSLRVASTDLLQDLFRLEGAATLLTSPKSWEIAYAKDAHAAVTAAVNAQDALYERIHSIRRESLFRLVGKDWLDLVARDPSYAWFLGKDRGRPSLGDRAARELAWLDYACACRNRVLHHRAQGIRLRYVVLPSMICEVYRTKAPKLADVVSQLGSARRTHGPPGAVPRAIDAVAYLTDIAENVRRVNPSASDAMYRAVRSSNVYIMSGSAAFVDNLDSALSRILEERFKSES